MIEYVNKNRTSDNPIKYSKGWFYSLEKRWKLKE